MSNKDNNNLRVSQAYNIKITSGKLVDDHKSGFSDGMTDYIKCEFNKGYFFVFNNGLRRMKVNSIEIKYKRHLGDNSYSVCVNYYSSVKYQGSLHYICFSIEELNQIACQNFFEHEPFKFPH